MRWLERPMRCMMRQAPFGAPTLTTRSTSPQSMPRSSVAVQTTALQLARDHRRLDPAALRHVERAVVERDGEPVVVEVPQLLERVLRLHARVDEDERRLVLPDEIVDRRHRQRRPCAPPAAGSGRCRACGYRARAPPSTTTRSASSPPSSFTASAFTPTLALPARGRGIAPLERVATGISALLSSPLRGGVGGGGVSAVLVPRRRRRKPRDQVAPQVVRLAHRRREPDGRQACGASVSSRARPSESRSPRFEVTSECSSSSTTRFRPSKSVPRLAVGEQQRELLRAWSAGCPAAARSAGRACAPGVSPVRVSMRIGRPISRDRRLEIAGDVDRERLQGRDVEGVEAIASGPSLRGHAPPARQGSAGSRRASCPRRSARRAGRSGPRAPCPAGRAGAPAASSRGFRTSGGNARAVEPLTLSARPEDRT